MMFLYRFIGIMLLFSMMFIMQGCFFIPFPRHSIVEPQLTIYVVNEEQEPLTGAHVHFIAAFHPHHVVHHSNQLVTDNEGKVATKETVEFEWVYPFMIHGIPIYYWTWCVEKEGYLPSVTEIQATENQEYTVILKKAGLDEQKSCIADGGYFRVE